MKSWMMFRTVGVATLALTVSAIDVRAQDVATPNCDRAARGVLERPLPAPGTDGWNHFMELTSCGTRGATVIAGVLQSPLVRAETDAGRLDALTGMLDGWFATPLVTAYEAVAANPASSPAMRLRTMWLLSGLLAPTTEVAGPLQGYTASSCGAYERVTPLRGAPNGLPQQAYDDARLAFAKAASDPTASEAVRGTARCWSDVVGGQALASAGNRGNGNTNANDNDDRSDNGTTTVVNQTVINQAPQVTIIEPIEVRYECDGRFTVWNASPSLMSVRYEVVGAGVGGWVHVGGRNSHAFVAARVGPLRFYIGTREIAYVRYERRSCGSWHNGYTTIIASRMYYPRPVYVNPRPVVVVRNNPVVVVPRGRPSIPVIPRGGYDRPDRGRNDGGRDGRDNDGRDRNNDGDRGYNGNRGNNGDRGNNGGNRDRTDTPPRGGRDNGNSNGNGSGRVAQPTPGNRPDISKPPTESRVRTAQPRSAERRPQ